MTCYHNTPKRADEPSWPGITEIKSDHCSKSDYEHFLQPLKEELICASLQLVLKQDFKIKKPEARTCFEKFSGASWKEINFSNKKWLKPVW